MLHAMIRHVLWIPFVLVVSAPFVVACDQLKKDSADAAAVAVPPATPVVPVAPAVDPNAAAPATGVAPVAPLGGGGVAPGTAAPGTTKPLTDGGKPADAGAVVVTDAGKTAPTPTPTFTFPTAIPGFDAGGFKPPPGFPTTLPTFPPPAK